MTKQFVQYDLALALSKKKFDEPCFGKYTKNDSDGIFWLIVTEASYNMEKKVVIYGSPRNYNTNLFSKEGTISAPIYQQVVDWLREKHKIVIHPDYVDSNARPVYCIKWHNGLCHNEMFIDGFDKAIYKALDIII